MQNGADESPARCLASRKDAGVGAWKAGGTDRVERVPNE